MDRLERALGGLVLTQNASPGLHSNIPQLIRQGRIYSIASSPAILSVVTVLRDYIFADITHSGPYDNVALVGIYEKFNQVLNILYGDDQNRTLNESRTLACIALELHTVVRGVNEGLADELKRKLGRDARMDLEWEWHQSDFRETDEDDATKLETRTAMFADLYAKGLVSLALFTGTLTYVLKRSTTPGLYTVLLRCFLMRAMTDTAPKISPETWKTIRERWFAIERGFTGTEAAAYRVMNDVLFVFGEDAQVPERTWCGLPFCEEVEFAPELEEFCERLVWDAKGYLEGKEEGSDEEEEEGGCQCEEDGSEDADDEDEDESDDDDMCVDMENLGLN